MKMKKKKRRKKGKRILCRLGRITFFSSSLRSKNKRMKNVLWSSKVWREPWNRFFVGGCKKEHKLCPYGPDQSWRWWPPIMRRFAPTHLLLSSEFQTLSPIRSQSLSTFLLFFFIFFFPFFFLFFFQLRFFLGTCLRQ